MLCRIGNKTAKDLPEPLGIDLHPVDVRQAVTVKPVGIIRRYTRHIRIDDCHADGFGIQNRTVKKACHGDGHGIFAGIGHLSVFIEGNIHAKRTVRTEVERRPDILLTKQISAYP